MVQKISLALMYVLVLLVACMPNTALAICEDALVRATYSTNSSVSSDWRLASLVTKENGMRPLTMGVLTL
jgi:hypothetical protein